MTELRLSSAFFFRRHRPLLPPMLLLCCLLVFVGPAHAWGKETLPVSSDQRQNTTAAGKEKDEGEGEGEGEGEDEDEDEDDSLLERTIEAIDERHAQISRRVLATADWLDSFFASERIDAEAQETRLVVGFSLFAEEYRGAELDLASRFRLSLPFASERLQLVLSGDPDDDTDTVPRQELLRRLREQSDRTVTVGLRYQLSQTLRSNTSLRAGVRVRKGNPVLLLEPRYRHHVPLGPWLFRFTQRFVAFTDDTYEVRSIFDLERPLPEISDEFFLRITAEGNWLSDRIGYQPALHLNLFQTLSRRRVFDYRISNFFQTRPNYRRESTVLSVLYRQRLGRDWLYGEIAPQLAFPRERNFQMTPGIMLNFGMILGYY